jgi:hypothetical protein
LSKKSLNVPKYKTFIKAYQQSIIERLSIDEKFILIEDSLKRIIIQERNHDEITDPIDQIILDYYDNPKKSFKNKMGSINLTSKDKSYGILRFRRDIYERFGKEVDDSIHNEPIYFRLINRNLQQIYYEYDESENKFNLSTSLSESDKRKPNLQPEDYDVDNNENLIVGWINKKNILEKNNKERFKIINKIGYIERTKQDGSTLEKGKRSGAICGTAMNCRTKQEISEVIKYLLKFDKYLKKSIKKPPKSKTKNNLGKSLCEELELLLRCLEFKNVNKDRHFYKYDESIIMNK